MERNVTWALRRIAEYKRHSVIRPRFSASIGFRTSQISDISLWQAMSKIEKQAETNRSVFPRREFSPHLLISRCRLTLWIASQSKHFDNANCASRFATIKGKRRRRDRKVICQTARIANYRRRTISKAIELTFAHIVYRKISYSFELHDEKVLKIAKRLHFISRSARRVYFYSCLEESREGDELQKSRASVKNVNKPS